MTATDSGERALDLFAGPGGWDVAARDLGVDTLGIESTADACATRRAAGLATVHGDVRRYGPAIRATRLRPRRGLIASPPCQSFSIAGTGTGRQALDKVLSAIDEMVAFAPVQGFDDERTALVLEPLRWALDAHRLGRPYRWLAFEQVPSVLPVWQAMADHLGALGYATAVGRLNAEQYGVPQTRTRAFLIASLDRPSIQLPAPTHSRYYPRDPARLDLGVLPWVTMAQALGWGLSQRPYPALATSRTTGGPDALKVGGSRARQIIYDAAADPARWVLRSQYSTHGVYANRPSRAADGAPAPTITSHANRNKWAHPDYDELRLGIAETALLQTFPDGYPWQGTRTQVFRQIGNAVPPLLARAVLGAVLGSPE